jgi:small GTP-binding protein
MGKKKKKQQCPFCEKWFGVPGFYRHKKVCGKKTYEMLKNRLSPSSKKINSIETFKLILAGDGGVGRKKLIQRYVTGEFETKTTKKLDEENEGTRKTIGVEFFLKDIKIDGVGYIRLQIWMFGGEERFRFLLPTYVKGATGIMFVFSLTNMLTLSHFDDWLPILRNYDPHIPILLVGSKLDLKNLRRVQKHEAIEVAKSRGCRGYVEVSSKEGINVDEAFETMTRLMWEHEQRKPY